MSTPPSRPPRRPALLLIGIYDFVKGGVLILLAVGLLRLLHRDVQEVVLDWARALRLDLQNRLVTDLFARAGLVNPRDLGHLSALSALLGALNLAEGIGLCLGKRWAELLAIVATAVFVPTELYELTRHATPVRAAVLAINVSLVIYLASRLRRRDRATP